MPWVTVRGEGGNFDVPLETPMSAEEAIDLAAQLQTAANLASGLDVPTGPEADIEQTTGLMV